MGKKKKRGCSLAGSQRDEVPHRKKWVSLKRNTGANLEFNREGNFRRGNFRNGKRDPPRRVERGGQGTRENSKQKGEHTATISRIRKGPPPTRESDLPTKGQTKFNQKLLKYRSRQKILIKSGK